MFLSCVFFCIPGNMYTFYNDVINYPHRIKYEQKLFFINLEDDCFKFDFWIPWESVLQHDSGSTEVIQRPHRTPMWNSACVVLHLVSEDIGGSYPQTFTPTPIRRFACAFASYSIKKRIIKYYFIYNYFFYEITSFRVQLRSLMCRLSW